MTTPSAARRRRTTQLAIAGSAATAITGVGIAAAQTDGTTAPEPAAVSSTPVASLDIEGHKVAVPADTSVLGDQLDASQAQADSPATESPGTVSPASASPESPAESPDVSVDVAAATVTPPTPETAPTPETPASIAASPVSPVSPVSVESPDIEDADDEGSSGVG